MEKRIIVTALLITLFSVVFSMSGDGGNVPVVKNESENVDSKVIENTNKEKSVPVVNTGTVKDQFGIDTGMTKEELEKFKEDYLKYQEKNKIYEGERTYFSKINILEMDKFKKYEIGLNKTLDIANINDFIIWSELIIVGSYTSFEIENDDKSAFPVTYNIKIDEVLYNGTEYNSIPTNIIMKSTNIYNHSVESLTKLLQEECNKNRKYIFFLSRYDFHYFKKSYVEGRSKEYVKDNCFEPYIFTYLFFSRREIKNGKIAKDTYKSDFDEDNWLELNDLKRNIKEISKINDRENFYKRSYK